MRFINFHSEEKWTSMFEIFRKNFGPLDEKKLIFYRYFLRSFGVEKFFGLKNLEKIDHRWMHKKFYILIFVLSLHIRLMIELQSIIVCQHFISMHFIMFIDVESTGQHLTRNEMPCFAACLVDEETMRLVDEFIVYIKPQDSKDFQWEQRTLDEFWDKPENKQVKADMLKNVEASGIEPKEAMKKFVDWVNHIPMEIRKNTTIWTDTAGYDVAWMNRYLSEAGYSSVNYLLVDDYQSTRDSNSFYRGIANILPGNGDKSIEAAFKKLGIDYANFEKHVPFPHDHNPLNDVKNASFKLGFVLKVLKSKQ